MAVNILKMTERQISNRWKAMNGVWTQLPFEEACHNCPVKKSPEIVMIQSNKIQHRLHQFDYIICEFLDN